MNYENIYNQIINRARYRIIDGYTERHHIIPKCLGGTDINENLVNLTAKEHFICHKILCKMYPDNDKLKFALWAMCNLKNKKHIRNYVISASEYEYIRKTVSAAKLGKNSRPTRYIPSAETRKKLSESNKGREPWNKGLVGYKKGIPKSKEHREKISIANKGFKHSTESKLKMSSQRKGVIQPKKECPYCKRLIDPGNFAQYHGNNCKLNLLK